MNIYRILNRKTNKWWEGQAASAQDTCAQAGWLIGDCWVRVLTPRVPDPSTESGFKGGGWGKPKE